MTTSGSRSRQPGNARSEVRRKPGQPFVLVNEVHSDALRPAGPAPRRSRSARCPRRAPRSSASGSSSSGPAPARRPRQASRLSLGEVLAQDLGAAQVDVDDLAAGAPLSAWAMTRTTRGSAPATSISCAHSSGTSPRPTVRAAAAGNSLVRSGVAVKMTEIRSSMVRPLRSSICPQQLDDSLGHLDRVVGASSWVAPRTASHGHRAPLPSARSVGVR